MSSANNNLDSILTSIGEFGKFQCFLVFLIITVSTINFFSTVTYIFETTPVNHRCKILDCDSESNQFNPQWLINAVPFNNGKPSRCTKFQHNPNSTCTIENFNNDTVEKCNEYIYETTEKSIMQDFNLHCDENIKMLTAVGTISGVGKFIGLPITGYISDRYGRKTVMIWSTVLAGILGIIRSFSTSYAFFVTTEFIEASVGAGIYSSVYILGSEFVGPKKRALITTFQFLSFGMGSIILGVTAWALQSWRILLRVLYSFYLLILFYYWLLPESVRWLISQKKEQEVVTILRKIAQVNGKEIPQGKLEELFRNTSDSSETTKIPLRTLFKSFTLTIRCILCSLLWIISLFIYYGLTVTSTTLSGHRYLNYVLTAMIELPAYIISFFIIDKLGRRVLLFTAYALACTSSIAYILVPLNIYWIKLCLYLLSKFGITLAIPAIYMISNEMFPTSVRQTLLSVCSMFGRIGNTLAPQLILLQEVWKYLPLVLFTILSAIACSITFILPETKGILLPDTIEEAENIGKRKKKTGNNGML
ncbi:hypothetical protein FQA39_LY04868 [Lamprigera yunnana]|nr:hypothetical protein FQA39_LY04868 [Lamprigera yunnana]